MKLKKIIVDNYRCFGPGKTEIEFDEITGIIGANSTGKTALMKALVKMFGDKNGDIKREDFHIGKNENPEN